MHGLINRSIQSFVCDSYSIDIWVEIAAKANLDFVEFEAMLSYEDALTPRVLDAAPAVLGRPRSDIMEDIGTYLVSHPSFESLRRLLRFGGMDFEDLLHSLDDLPARARLAVNDLDLPGMELIEHAAGQYDLICEAPVAGYAHFMMGILRVMADDYGALALLEHSGGSNKSETIAIVLVAADFSEGRSFDLGARAG